MSGKADTDIMGVKGLWVLERLERMGLSTAKLALVVMVGCVAGGLLLLVLFGRGVPEDHVFVWITLFEASFVGMFVFVTLALARWTQSDLASLLPIAREIGPSLALLKPSRRLLLGIIVLNVALDEVLVNGAIGVTGTVELGQFWTTSVGFLIALVFPFLIGVTGALFLAVAVTQVKALTHAARHIDIDILELDHYPRLANPLARFVVCALVIVSFVPTMSFLDNPTVTAALVLSVPIVVVLALLLIGAYAYPVWLLRGRIRAAKDTELNFVFRSLRGDEEAMSSSRIRDRAGSLSFSELLDYRTFIESLWDWPVAPQLQKVLLIGLLPPTTWVLAALIENAIGAVVAAG